MNEQQLRETAHALVAGDKGILAMDESIPLDDPTKRWKISESDYTEREYWEDYEAAYEDAFYKCNSHDAPWFVVPSDHKWFRDLAVSEIIVVALEQLKIEAPAPTVDIEDIRQRYHTATEEEKQGK